MSSLAQAMHVHLSNPLAKHPPSYKRRKDYHMGRILGEGTFGIVRLAKSKNHRIPGPVAIKIVPKKILNGNLHLIESETHVVKELSHPNIVRLYDNFESKDKYYLVFEPAMGGEVFERVLQSGHLTEPGAAHVVASVARALDYIHAHEFVHRDIKPENIMYLTSPEQDEQPRIVLVDFGVAQHLNSEGEKLRELAGSLGYAAPEVVARQPYGREVDMWSLGAVCFVLLSGRMPFQQTNPDELLEAMRSRPVQFEGAHWSNISEEAKDFIRQCMTLDSHRRMRADQALQHPWITGEPQWAGQVADGALVPGAGEIGTQAEEQSANGVGSDAGVGAGSAAGAGAGAGVSLRVRGNNKSLPNLAIALQDNYPRTKTRIPTVQPILHELASSDEDDEPGNPYQTTSSPADKQRQPAPAASSISSEAQDQLLTIPPTPPQQAGNGPHTMLVHVNDFAVAPSSDPATVPSAHTDYGRSWSTAPTSPASLVRVEHPLPCVPGACSGKTDTLPAPQVPPSTSASASASTQTSTEESVPFPEADTAPFHSQEELLPQQADHSMTTTTTTSTHAPAPLYPPVVHNTNVGTISADSTNKNDATLSNDNTHSNYPNDHNDNDNEHDENDGKAGDNCQKHLTDIDVTENSGGRARAPLSDRPTQPLPQDSKGSEVDSEEGSPRDASSASIYHDPCAAEEAGRSGSCDKCVFHTRTPSAFRASVIMPTAVNAADVTLTTITSATNTNTNANTNTNTTTTPDDDTTTSTSAARSTTNTTTTTFPTSLPLPTSTTPEASVTTTMTMAPTTDVSPRRPSDHVVVASSMGCDVPDPAIDDPVAGPDPDPSPGEVDAGARVGAKAGAGTGLGGSPWRPVFYPARSIVEALRNKLALHAPQPTSTSTSTSAPKSASTSAPTSTS